MYNSYQLNPQDFPGVVVTDEFRRYPTLVKPSGEQVCLTCNGRGTITDYRTEDGWSSFPQTLACPDCDGPEQKRVDVIILNAADERVETEIYALAPGDTPESIDWDNGKTLLLKNGFSVVVESDWRIEQALMGV